MLVNHPTRCSYAPARQRPDSSSNRPKKVCERAWIIHIGLLLGPLWFVVLFRLSGTWFDASNYQAASKRMIRTRSKGKIVFVSSVLGYFGMIGYSTYSPGKHAIRGRSFASQTSNTHVDHGV